MSKRIASFFGRKEEKNQANSINEVLNENDTASVSSEVSGGNSVSTETSFTIKQRVMNFKLGLSNSDNFEEDIDGSLKSLYIDPDILERKCQLSVRGIKYTDSDLFMEDMNDNDQFTTDEFHKSSKHIDDIPSEYFLEDYDPFKSYITMISNVDRNELNDFFMNHIMNSDVNHDIIMLSLSSQLRLKQDDIMNCMNKAYSINLGLFSATTKVCEVRRNLQASISILENGSIKVSKLKRRQERLLLVSDTLKCLKSVQDLCVAMNLYITTGEVGRAAEYAKMLLDVLNDSTYNKFKSLSFIENSIYKGIENIRQKADKALFRLCCRKFFVCEYDTVIKSYLILDKLQESINDKRKAFVGCIEGLASRIQRNQIEDIESCCHTAALECIYTSQHRKLKDAQEIDIQGTYSPMKNSDMMDLAELPIYSLYQRITSELIASCIIRTCELCTDVIFTSFSLSQWHRNPFDARNEDSSFLYSTLETDAQTIDEPFRSTYNAIIDSRSGLWNDISCAIIELLDSVVIEASVSLDDIITIMWSIDTINQLGLEFCGVDSNLKSILTIKCEEYIHNVHIESFNTFRQMVETDPWRNVPVKIAEYGSILGILKSKLTISKSENSFLRLVVKYEMDYKSDSVSESTTGTTSDSLDEEAPFQGKSKSILYNFATLGNPFHFMSDTTDETNTLDHNSEASIKIVQDEISKYLTSFLDEKDGTFTNTSKRNKEINDSLVVTQSVLNGLAKYCSRYLQMMHLFPLSSFQLWSSLCQLFDYYLCFVFKSFLPLEIVQNFFQKPTKMTLPAPDQFKDFEALKSYLEDALNQDILIGKIMKSESQDEGFTQDSQLQNNDLAKLSALLSDPIVVEFENADTFYGINNRIVAAESCWFAARILNDIKIILKELIPSELFSTCVSYISNYQLVASQLRSLVYKSVCPPLLKQQMILSMMSDNAGWDSKKLRDTHHEFINVLANNCKEVWKYMNTEENFADATHLVREQFWLELCQSAFDILLEGFSKIRKCSTEGKALMTMDVAMLQDGLDNIHSCRPPRGKLYMDNFILATYMTEENTIKWVQEFWQAYAYRHIHGLLTLNLSSVLNSKRLKDAVSILESFYLNSDDSEYISCFDAKQKDISENTSKFRDILGKFPKTFK